ncbi:MAG: ribosomal protein S18-alanine N-acetyltransferase [Firmicutes bacterium]|nr:ribosomal protein S18-alanine N-acetyltransferase [Bacillota bacterium]MBQ6296034.1 ribosomal protein S18-alanine N-acetyltransferase [Bacillota bacterium]MBR0051876.1 ribosomal protein S18-alanine N-acetyltransferase [Bacillota bacterium]
MIIRRATADDVDRIAEMEKVCFPEEPWSRDMVAAEFSGLNPTRYFAAEEDGRIVAYAGVWVIPPEGYITNVAVLPEYRRRGVASQVLQTMIDECLAEGVTDITLEVRVSNDPAIALYRSFGFEEAGVRRRYYQDGEDALIMWTHHE